MQEQTGSDACGVFAIAVTTALCYEEDPNTIVWKQSLMWQECFEANKKALFPVEDHVTNEDC